MKTCLLLSSLLLAPGALAQVPLSWGPSHQVKVKREEGVIALTLEAGNPHFWTGVVPGSFDPEKHTVFALEYFAEEGVSAVGLRFTDPEEKTVYVGSQPMPVAETWQPFSIDLKTVEKVPKAGYENLRFHVSMKGKAGSVVRIRKMVVRAPTAEELKAAKLRAVQASRRQADADLYLDYLRTDFPAELTTVHVGVNDITFIGQAAEPLKLVGYGPGVASHHTPVGAVEQGRVEPGPQQGFRLVLPRRDPVSGEDRMLWRWRLMDGEGNFMTACRWPTVEGPMVGRKLERLKGTHPKGLGGMPTVAKPDHEIFDLGIQHATMNFVLTGVLQTSPKPGLKPWVHEGRTYYVNERGLAGRDVTVKRLTERGIIVTCILLVSNHRDAAGRPISEMTHPEAESRGIYSMPNLTTPEATAYYAAVMHFLTDRYSRADGVHGRISNWVLHNEVDQAGTWTNMGGQPLARYLESYVRSARIVYHTARKFDPTARVFMSLTHHWTKQSSGEGTYVVRDMIDLFAEAARVEGDFEWGVAYHPYPRDLRNPDTWNDADVTDDFDTPYITPKNIEVLPRYLAQERLLYQGKPRGILLSEQGFNTPTLSIEDQRRQVAGLIYMFRKLEPLKTIEAYHLHRYQDMPEGEGGLRLGIITETGEHKLGWEAYKAIGTEAVGPFETMADEVMAAGQ